MTTMLSLTHKEFLQVDRDYEMAASVAHLVYEEKVLMKILRSSSSGG